MSPDSPHYQVKQTNGVSIVTVLDPELLKDEKETFYKLADSLGGDATSQGVVLDLTNIRVFQSSMLGVMINFQKRLKEHDKDLRLCSVDPQVLRVFELTKMDQIFKIQPTEQAAIHSIQGKSGAGWISKIFGGFGGSQN
ncbi:anti-anti-sigma regulatory factor, SpoIIAA [Singulisphaera sp. GP187]|uniref:STAS domain-containing protein n=1 Tax=Singulisphaera sp. GP187 TaxID=1882752 RepID=UPI0009266FF7|nr:STAS domain-containing protein [Singulisphaera sp. GP187]SIN95972.1 anti-anti-sigma regulatory factor, SpoIIAA [Singulisphaera sp. GP187]